MGFASHFWKRSTAIALAWTSALLVGCGVSGQHGSQGSSHLPQTPAPTITPSQSAVRPGNIIQLVATDSSVTSIGVWKVQGGSANGTISPQGTYTAPDVVLSAPAIITYTVGNASSSARVSILNPVPVLEAVSPSIAATLSTTVSVSGTGFLPASQLVVNGIAAPTVYVDSSHLTAIVHADATSGTSLELHILNPDPGSATSNSLQMTVSLPQMAIAPVSISGGSYSLSATLSGVAPGSVLIVNGQRLNTTVSGNVATASGYLPPWLEGHVEVDLTGPDGVTTLAQGREAITPTAVSFDTAARFTTQAGWGPRPDVVLHVQQVGLQKYLDEQIAAPVGTYDVTHTSGIRSFFLNITTGQSLLRLRTAWSFQSYMPGSIFFSNMNMAIPWEKTLERDAFTSYTQILRDVATDPNVGSTLNLPGNAVALHPNQNFARELMQLFSIGTVQLNDDGTPQLDPSGHQIPAYDDQTVIEISRALTGWNYGTPQDPWFTGPFQFNSIDMSVPLVANDAQHDHGSKILFGNQRIPAGQTAEQDLNSVLEILMSHPNTAPFISRLLIQRLVKSQPSSAYVQRVAKVFRDDGHGVKGNLAVVIPAILLDPEARAGDTNPQADDGFLQDPVYEVTFMLSVLQISSEDDQSTYLFRDFSEPLWQPATIFAYFSPSYIIPGTQTNSPEFQLLTNFTDIQRSQLVYSVVTGQQPGFNNSLSGWLYDNFKTVPEMVEATNHLLYHGNMPTAEQEAIKAYCAGVQDARTQITSAVFLALNGNAYLVSH